ncbi:MAG: hypothetical protein BMS9Abin37_0155 [Acidobacteriota bacterium]|nr:MAG: hypothetical protein BMS9Abin37_0155 [Acidobacteriota bacterium]
MNKTIRTIPSKYILFSLAVITSMVLAGIASADPEGPGVQTVVKGSVDEALTSLTKMVADNGMMIMGELHQGKVLEMTGLKVKSESVFVGNPTIGKKLFTLAPGAGLAVPVRVNIYEDSHGRTVFAYVPLSQQLASFNNPQINEIAAMVDGKLAKMAEMLAK